MQTRKALGKGLASLIPTEPKIVASDKHVNLIEEVPVDSIVPNRLQPRRDFSEESLKELTESIRQNGVIQPLVVATAVGGRHELIAGERRLRAARAAGLEKVPVVVKEADPEMMLELAIIENVQREDLNPIEEAEAYRELIEEFSYTQEEVAAKVSKSRVYVANNLRLLYLPKVIQEDVVVGRLTAGHARALLAVSDLQEQLRIREIVLQSCLTVRDIERLVQDAIKKSAAGSKLKKKSCDISPQIKSVLDEMINSLGTKVKINPYGNNKGGQIVIEYYSLQDLNRIYKKITG